MKNCKFCNAINDDMNKYCDDCGKPFDSEPVNPQYDSQGYCGQPNNPQPNNYYGNGQAYNSGAPYNPQYFNEASLPPEYRTPSIGEYALYMFLSGIPIVGLVVLLILAFSNSSKKSIKNFARAQLIFVAIAFVIMIISFFFIIAVAGSIAY